MEHKEVFVSSHDILRVTIYRQLQHFVILWIAASLNPFDNFHQKCSFYKGSKKSFTLLARYVTIESFSPQNFIDFLQQIERE